MKVIKPIEGIDLKRSVYVCSVCEGWFNWGEGATWFGSYKEMENNPEKLIYCCSDKCKQAHEPDKPKRTLGDFDVWYKPCEKCGYDTAKSTPPREGNKTCWKCGNGVSRDYTDRALKKP